MFQNSDKKAGNFPNLSLSAAEFLFRVILTVPPSGEAYRKIEFERVMLSLGPGWPKFPSHRGSPKKNNCEVFNEKRVSEKRTKNN